jgi:hypothetical protein
MIYIVVNFPDLCPPRWFQCSIDVIRLRFPHKASGSSALTLCNFIVTGSRCNRCTRSVLERVESPGRSELLCNIQQCAVRRAYQVISQTKLSCRW